ncbi:hypothetical protein Kpol_1050p85 [Vanderwaltozyma polyspora DSM 70294]|uniref:Nucleolar protein 19 n=1 Tax=Vanderwaltozyma polyspora (strain ATCC 22028 / DSM 70294 / BCRC 21397 / CBS 2163 / NBRC 10782 / NRRL Y-8283 / UCD 57-17) TaxID=436907 RepID=A7TEX9_VANPO|nr:uncharacterized protein Kpol_1050p85 [Vanderwaltozyma polyspora DSM 70294]EDO19225.1 hypothetical protein Kpol_1050p85 [Vanderwaltozyma polyspora DSM 70294]
MSRAKEIQEKLDLQAKLQLSFSNNTSKVLGWLNDSEKEVGNGAAKANNNVVIDSDRNLFYHLPVVQTGSGLNLNLNSEDNEENANDINTVGDFINSDKKVSTLSKQKRKLDGISERRSIYRVAKDDTKAMISLKRKMRQGQIQQKRQSDLNGTIGKPGNKVQQLKGKQVLQVTADEESSDDDEPLTKKTTKKTFGLLFSGSKKGKK